MYPKANQKFSYFSCYNLWYGLNSIVNYLFVHFDMISYFQLAQYLQTIQKIHVI